MKPRYTDNRYQHGYRKACETDIRKTFARVRKEQAAAIANVTPINAAKTSNDRATAASGDALASGGTRRKANGA